MTMTLPTFSTLKRMVGNDSLVCGPNRPTSHDVTKCARRAVHAACFVEDKEAFFLHVISHKRKMRLHALADIFKVLIFLRL